MENPTPILLIETQETIKLYHRTSSQALEINRTNETISFVRSGNPDSNDQQPVLRSVNICGVMGIIQLISGKYLLVVRSGIYSGSINGNRIYEMKLFDLIPFRKSSRHLTPEETLENQKYLEMLNEVLTTPYFYFSFTYDLSHNLQTLENSSPQFFNQTLFERSESKFIWNYNMLQKLTQIDESNQKISLRDLNNFFIPLIHGFVTINTLEIEGHNINLILISRRSTGKAGPRLFQRGINENAEVANFVETEQIVESIPSNTDRESRGVASFVQIRGSIPLFWEQCPNLKYKPKPTLIPDMNHMDPYQRHFTELTFKYNKVVIINLINQTGSESSLEKAFQEHSYRANMANVRYEAFDFHHECRNGWERVEVLMNRLSAEMEEFGFFYKIGGKKQDQEGIFRTNCIDCLDRTNVIQGMLAWRLFARILKHFGIIPQNYTFNIENDFKFKNIWADNGDIVSTEYSGTGALKSDFTRTGKRSWKGIMMDGWNSAFRYFKNNFIDGFRQDSIDLFLGRYNVERALLPYTKFQRGPKFYALPGLLFVFLVLFSYFLVIPSEYNSQNLLYILIFGSFAFATTGIIFIFGKEFVDNPRFLETTCGRKDRRSLL